MSTKKGKVENMTGKPIQHVFIIGSKGIPAAYGGFESFVDRLTLYKKNKNIQYHVSCAIDREDYIREKKEFTYHNARCFYVPWKKIGSARAVAYDIDALREVIAYLKKHNIERPVIYILACRIGPFLGYYAKKIHSLGGKLLINPDGHEWKRSKWNRLIKAYWKISERLSVKYADLMVCDSRAIEAYILEDYRKYAPSTVFIAYGAETEASGLADKSPEFVDWCSLQGVRAGEYYLIVGRFVPENNFETIIREFMASSSQKDLVIITGIENSRFFQYLKEKLDFLKDSRIKFVGTVYDRTLLKKIREMSFGYIHGHEVGGTNPSLLESLASTKLNLLLDVSFNRETGGDGAWYWSREKNSLSQLIGQAEQAEQETVERMGQAAGKRIREHYSWEYIVSEYEKLFDRYSRR